MNDVKHNPDKLDQLLDQGLAQYSQAEPLMGLEERLLARLETAEEEPVSWTTWFTIPRAAWTTAGLLLAAGIGLGMFLVTGPGEDIDYEGEPVEIAVNVKAPVETVTSPLPGSIALINVPVSPMPQIEETHSELRAAVFPAPAPPSEQEQLALRYARFNQQRDVAGVQIPAGIRDLEVAPLEVAPLEMQTLETPAKSTSSNPTTGTTK
jgi:hypothetical protein